MLPGCLFSGSVFHDFPHLTCAWPGHSPDKWSREKQTSQYRVNILVSVFLGLYTLTSHDPEQFLGLAHRAELNTQRLLLGERQATVIFSICKVFKMAHLRIMLFDNVNDTRIKSLKQVTQSGKTNVSSPGAVITLAGRGDLVSHSSCSALSFYFLFCYCCCRNSFKIVLLSISVVASRWFLKQLVQHFAQIRSLRGVFRMT